MLVLTCAWAPTTACSCVCGEPRAAEDLLQQQSAEREQKALGASRKPRQGHQRAFSDAAGRSTSTGPVDPPARSHVGELQVDSVSTKEFIDGGGYDSAVTAVIHNV